MSQFATPFIVINLGCEMLYIVDQRLKAQEIASDKCEKVLTDISSVLLHSKLLEELFIPQPVATQSVIKQLLQDISASSIMKLDDYSMNKLWDLMTMMYKWQISVMTNQNIFDITRRHLKSVAFLLPKNFPKCFCENAIRKFETLSTRFTDDDYKCLNNTLILWFSEYHLKISVLLRLGLQKKDGTFCQPSSINKKFIDNLGENIYSYDSKKNLSDDSISTNTDEINCLLSQITKNSDAQGQTVALRLPIEIGESSSLPKIKSNKAEDTPFKNIEINIKSRGSDLAYNPEVAKSPQEDLLEMLENC